MGRFSLRRSEDGRLKAAQIIGNASLGGVVSCILNYYRHADTSRWVFDFFTYAPSPLDAQLHEIDPAARVFSIPRLDTQFYRAVPALRVLLAEGGYAVAHSHMTTLSAFALFAAKRAGVPVRICHAHSTFDKNSDHAAVKALLRPFAAKNATMRLACGKLAAQNLYRNKADQAILLPNAIDLDRFSPADQAERDALRAQLGLQGTIFLFVGRFVYQKNLAFLLDAFARARISMPSTLLLVGDGQDKADLIRQARALAIENAVRFVPPCDPLPYYRAADVFVLPSRYEGMPVVAAEAQATGLPCLFSDAVTREADICGEAEFLPLNVARWADAMQKRRPRLQACTQKLRDAGYDISLQGHLLCDLYESALREKGFGIPSECDPSLV